MIEKNNKTWKLNPHDFGEGAKLIEHAWIDNEFVNAVYTLIYKNPCKVAWVGDYSVEPYDPATDAYAKAMPRDKFARMYRIAWCDKTPFTSPDFLDEQLEQLNLDVKNMFLVNHDLQCCVDMAAFVRRCTVQTGALKGCCLSPLPLLTACGNNRGGGDFRQGGRGYEDVGTWAFHRIEHTEQVPEGYTEQFCCFIEAGNQ